MGKTKRRYSKINRKYSKVNRKYSKINRKYSKVNRKYSKVNRKYKRRTLKGIRGGARTKEEIEAMARAKAEVVKMSAEMSTSGPDAFKKVYDAILKKEALEKAKSVGMGVRWMKNGLNYYDYGSDNSEEDDLVYLARHPEHAPIVKPADVPDAASDNLEAEHQKWWPGRGALRAALRVALRGAVGAAALRA